MSHTIKGIEDLSKSQAVLYRSYLATNRKNTNQQKEITRLCELGTEGHEEIIAIAELLKVNSESTATIKVQVSSAMAKLQTGLTLQGLGKNDDHVVIAPKNTDNQPIEAPEAGEAPEAPEASVEPNTKKYNIEDLEDVFFKFSRDTQQVELMVLIEGSKLLKKDKKALMAVLDIEVLKIAK